MKKALFLLLFIPSFGHASGIFSSASISSSTLPSGSTFYVQNSNDLQPNTTFYVSSGSVSGNLTAGTFIGSGTGLTGVPASSLTGTISTSRLPITSNDLISQNTAVSSVVAVTSPNDGSPHTYNVGGYLTVTAVSVNTITLQVIYTDQNSASQTASFFGEGTTTAAIGATGSFPFPPMTIRVKVNTSITIKTTIVGVGSETYDVGGWIHQIN